MKSRNFISREWARHYTINHLTGEIQFGDGKYGMIPPQGRNNIPMTRHKTDGGARGNKPANTINQLKTTIPYIDRVINLEAAAGGSDREPIDRVQERGQKFIRHRGGAVTVQDFEDLAYEASADIARVKAIAPTYDPLTEELWLDRNIKQEERDARVNKLKEIKAGLVKLFIVPRNDSPQPIPSLALIDRVETYLRDRASPTLNLWVGSPQWLQVSVTAEVVPTALEFADAVRTAVIQRLETFLHPLTGGVSGQGWEFGREPHESDFYSLIEAIDSVDYVRSLSVKIEPEPPSPPEPFLIFYGSHNITLFLSEIGG
jgi:predicted phage baseplate assembly protein